MSVAMVSSLIMSTRWLILRVVGLTHTHVQVQVHVHKFLLVFIHYWMIPTQDCVYVVIGDILGVGNDWFVVMLSKWVGTQQFVCIVIMDSCWCCLLLLVCHATTHATCLWHCVHTQRVYYVASHSDQLYLSLAVCIWQVYEWCRWHQCM